MKNQDESVNELWNDFLLLGDKYQKKFTVPEFGYQLVKFTSKMLFDTAPKEEFARTLLKYGIEDGIEWSIEELKRRGNKR